MRLTDNAPYPQTCSRRNARSLANILTGTLILIVTVVTTPFNAVAKTPGMLNCYKGTCYRVLTHAQTRARIGVVRRELASYYDEPGRDRYNPRLETSSGEMYDRYHDGHVASPIYLNGTELLLWNPRTKRAAHVRVNNNGPFWKRRTIDCSREVAKKLGFLQRGVAPLHVMVVHPPSRVESRYRRGRRYAPVPGYLGEFENFLQAVLNDPLARPVFFGPDLGQKIYPIKLLATPHYKKNHKPAKKKKPTRTVLYVPIARDPNAPTPNLEQRNTAQALLPSNVSPREQDGIFSAQHTPHANARPTQIAFLDDALLAPPAPERPRTLDTVHDPERTPPSNASPTRLAASPDSLTLPQSRPEPSRIASTDNAKPAYSPDEPLLRIASVSRPTATRPLAFKPEPAYSEPDVRPITLASLTASDTAQARSLSLLEFHIFHRRTNWRLSGIRPLIARTRLDHCLTRKLETHQCQPREHAISSRADAETGHTWTWQVDEDAAIADATRGLPQLYALGKSMIAEPKTGIPDQQDGKAQQLTTSTQTPTPIKTGSVGTAPATTPTSPNSRLPATPTQSVAAYDIDASEPVTTIPKNTTTLPGEVELADEVKAVTAKPKQKKRKRRARKRPKQTNCLYASDPISCMLGS